MSRNDLLVRVLAAIGGIVAIALAAATIDSPIETGGSGGSSPGSGTGDGGGDVIDQPPPPDDPASAGDVPAFLEYLVYAVLIVAVIALVWYLLANRREAVKLIAVGLVATLVGILLVSVFLEADGPAAARDFVEGRNASAADPGSGDGSVADVFPTSALFAVLAVVTAIFVGGVLLSSGSGEEDGREAAAAEADDPATGNEDAVAVGAAAGRAADRIDGATDVDNEIYRAWREMTRPLEVDRPESSTPREFAGAAVDAGLDRRHVDDLTRLFEDVRYGSTETTPALEERAVAILREIETEYGEEAAASAGSAGPDGSPRGDSR